MNGIRRRVVLSAAALLGLPAMSRAQAPAKPPACNRTGDAGGWSWRAGADHFLLANGGGSEDGTSIVINVGRLSKSAWAPGVPDRPVVVHYLPAFMLDDVDRVEVVRDGRAALAVADVPPYAISGGLGPASAFGTAFTEESGPLDAFVRAKARMLEYTLWHDDGTDTVLRVDARGLTAAMAGARAASDALARDREAGVCGDGGCFLTTAACGLLGLADDCFELRAARELRDRHLLCSAGGRVLVAEYYRRAPALAARLAACAAGRRTLARIYWTAILPCALLVRAGLPSLAARRYAAMFRGVAGCESIAE